MRSVTRLDDRRVQLDAELVVVQTAAGRATHLATTGGRTACGDPWERTRLRTDQDPTCRWCRAYEERAS